VRKEAWICSWRSPLKGAEAMRSNTSFGRNAAFATGSRGCDANFRAR
jgi:hypothetical protein